MLKKYDSENILELLDEADEEESFIFILYYANLVYLLSVGEEEILRELLVLSVNSKIGKDYIDTINDRFSDEVSVKGYLNEKLDSSQRKLITQDFFGLEELLSMSIGMLFRQGYMKSAIDSLIVASELTDIPYQSLILNLSKDEEFREDVYMIGMFLTSLVLDSGHEDILELGGVEARLLN